MLLHIKDLAYRNGDFSLDIRDLAIEAGEKLLLLGPSGSGKSTLLNLITGILTPQQGEISIGGANIAQLSGSARDRLRGEAFGIVFQTLNLMPFATALDNVRAAIAFAPSRRARVGSGDAERLLTDLGLLSTRVKTRVGDLSVGQQQRVSIARALLGAPPILIADEPTSALDHHNRDRFLDLLFDALDPARQGLIMVSHDEAIKGRFDRVLTMDSLNQGSTR